MDHKKSETIQSTLYEHLDTTTISNTQITQKSTSVSSELDVAILEDIITVNSTQEKSKSNESKNSDESNIFEDVALYSGDSSHHSVYSEHTEHVPFVIAENKYKWLGCFKHCMK